MQQENLFIVFLLCFTAECGGRVTGMRTATRFYSNMLCITWRMSRGRVKKRESLIDFGFCMPS